MAPEAVEHIELRLSTFSTHPGWCRTDEIGTAISLLISLPEPDVVLLAVDGRRPPTVWAFVARGH